MDVALWVALAAIVVILLAFLVSLQRLKFQIRLRDEEAHHLVTRRLPALMDAERGLPIDVPGPLRPNLADTPFHQEMQTAIGQFAGFADETRQRADRAAKATLISTMRGVQSLANEQQLAITEMQHEHDDPAVLAGLMKIDHANSQLVRRAQATAVLCGTWPGQQRSAAPVLDVVRGATSRIRDYLRIEAHSESELSVSSRAVEPVVLALAELLDNAARYSQPATQVQVHFQPAHNGLSIVVDDAGVGMNPEARERAKALLTGREVVDINKLGDPPQIGFALAGVLAARYGFKVFVEAASPYGGMRAVLFLPNELLTKAETPAPAPAMNEPAADQRTSTGLPKRQRRSHAVPAQSAEHGNWGTGTPSVMGAWQRGSLTGRGSEDEPDDEKGTSAS